MYSLVHVLDGFLMLCPALSVICTPVMLIRHSITHFKRVAYKYITYLVSIAHLPFAIKRWTVLHCSALYCTVLYCTALYCFSVGHHLPSPCRVEVEEVLETRSSPVHWQHLICIRETEDGMRRQKERER